jgi:type IV pilus assembly protein PilY1
MIADSGSATSIATNSGSLDADSVTYQASFDSTNWTGSLSAFLIGMDGKINSKEKKWDASEQIKKNLCVLT